MSNPFEIAGNSAKPQGGRPVGEVNKNDPLQKRVDSLVKSADLFLFMKGEPEMPQCGFSANIIGLLNQAGAPFRTFDILSDQDIRQGAKDYANWPTFPQLYFKGEFLGGNDIITEMFQSGELQKILTP